MDIIEILNKIIFNYLKYLLKINEKNNNFFAVKFLHNKTNDDNLFIINASNLQNIIFTNSICNKNNIKCMKTTILFFIQLNFLKNFCPTYFVAL